MGCMFCFAFFWLVCGVPSIGIDGWKWKRTVKREEVEGGESFSPLPFPSFRGKGFVWLVLRIERLFSVGEAVHTVLSN